MDLITTKYVMFAFLLIANLVETRNFHLIDKTLPGFTSCYCTSALLGTWPVVSLSLGSSIYLIFSA